MEEKKVGEVFEFERAVLQAIETEDMTCTECFFKYCESCDIHCIPSKRVDKKNVIFIKVEE